jgi:tetratricopeptide (TPR) repeat protein
VVLKALEKEAGRRYPTADALGADVRSYLDGLPVSARRPSVVYAAWRAVYRRRAAAVAVLATLVAAGGTYAFGVARQRAAAIRAAEERAVVAEVLADVLESANHAPHWSPGAWEVLESARGAVSSRVGNRSAVEADLLAMIADQYDALGRWRDALPLFERTVRLESQVRPNQPAHAMALLGLAGALLSQDEYPTETDFRRIDSLYSVAGFIVNRTFGANSPTSGLLYTHLARLRYIRRDYRAALTHAQHATSILESALRDSVIWNRRYVAIRQRTPPHNWGGGMTPPSRWVQGALWIALTQRGNAELALGRIDHSANSIFAAAHGLYRTNPHEHDTAMIFTTLGDVLWTQNSTVEAERAYRVSLALFQRLYGSSSRYVARCLDGITNSRYLAGDVSGALRSATRAGAVARESRDTLMIAHTSTTLGILYSELAEYDEAIRYFDGVLELLDSSNTHPDYLSYVVTARSRRSMALASSGQLSRASADAILASRESRRLPPSRRTSARIAVATILAANGLHAAAVDTLEVTLEQLWQPPVRTNPRMQARRVTQLLAEYYRVLGDVGSSQRYERLYASYSQ